MAVQVNSFFVPKEVKGTESIYTASNDKTIALWRQTGDGELQLSKVVI
jgi:hypothetical protein